MIPMVDHQPCHSAVDADILTRYEPGFSRTEIQHHIGDILWLSDSPAWLLHGIGARVGGSGRVDLSGRDRIDPDLSGKADRHRVRQRRDTALGSGVAFRLRLTHPVA